jgi:Major capsid protein N-terminus/Large eukaryotic DNA virus major capsid protein
MSGGIVQLVATGAQDEWLTGKPEVSFFRANYKRYTHYASSVERQLIQGTPQAGSISTIRLEKKGDLVSYMYLTARDSNGTYISNLDWSQVISRVQLYIGGQEIDSQDFQWLSDVEPVVGAQNFNQRYLNNQGGSSQQPTNLAASNQVASFFPLKFFFNKEWMLALPVVGLAFHDVEIRITWAPNNGAGYGLGAAVTSSGAGGTSTTPGLTGTYQQLQYVLWTNFIYLDAAEREFFAKTPMDMLIYQVQRVPLGITPVQELALAHPIKYLAFQSNNYNTIYSTGGGGGYGSTNALNAVLRTQINGVDVGDDKPLFHYTDIMQYYHTQFGYQTVPTASTYTANVAIIPYCLDTTRLQPTGTLNFSRLDTYRLITPVQLKLGSLTGIQALAQPFSQLRGNPGIGYLYAVNYNILRIRDGMGGLLYAN